MGEPLCVIGDRPGYSPRIGRLVAMMEYARRTTVDEVQGLTVEQLDHLHDAQSNSIGALLHHIAGIERYYQKTLGIEQESGPAEEQQDWEAAEELGDLGRRRLRGRPLGYYLDLLASLRARTLEAMRRRDDAWLDIEKGEGQGRCNRHWEWFHVFEDELNHRGQIRWLKRRLPAG